MYKYKIVYDVIFYNQPIPKREQIKLAKCPGINSAYNQLHHKLARKYSNMLTVNIIKCERVYGIAEVKKWFKSKIKHFFKQKQYKFFKK